MVISNVEYATGQSGQQSYDSAGLIAKRELQTSLSDDRAVDAM